MRLSAASSVVYVSVSTALRGAMYASDPTQVAPNPPSDFCKRKNDLEMASPCAQCVHDLSDIRLAEIISASDRYNAATRQHH